MNGRTSRRNFLRSTAAAGGWLVLPHLRAAEPRPDATDPNRGESAAHRPTINRNAIVTVVTQPASREANPRAGSWVYFREILARAGVFSRSDRRNHFPRWSGRRTRWCCSPGTCG